MATSVDFVVERVGSILQDTKHTRWTRTDLVDYLNEAQVAIIKKVPMANAVTSIETLVAGTRQTLPVGCTALLSVVRNYAGGSPGSAIRLVDMDVLDATSPNWHADTASATVQEYAMDPTDPYVYWVYPPQPATPTDVQIICAKVPPVINMGDNISLGDEYVNAIIEYMLHRAYSREAEYSGPEGRAATHLEQFIRELSRA